MGSSEYAAETFSLWFQNSCMKLNPEKFHLLFSEKKNHQVDICNEKLSSTCSEKHVEELRKKTSQKVCAMAKVSSLMRFIQRKRIVNSL